MYYGVVIGGSIIGVRMAANNAFGPGMQSFALGLLNAFHGVLPTVTAGPGGVTAQLPGGTNAPLRPPVSQPGGGTAPAAGCDTSFIQGQRYVDFRNGVYAVVIGGVVRASYPQKEVAEAAYNRLVCG
jgi:hypothetical protein